MRKQHHVCARKKLDAGPALTHGEHDVLQATVLNNFLQGSPVSVIFAFSLALSGPHEGDFHRRLTLSENGRQPDEQIEVFGVFR